MSELLPVKGVTFDLDGCLYDARRMRWRFILRNLGKGSLMRVTQRVRAEMREVEFANGNAFFAEQFARIAERIERSVIDIQPEVEKLFNERLCQVLKRIGPFAATREGLELLVESGFQIGVVSDFAPDEKLRALGLLDLPWAAKIGADGTGALKPNPRALLQAADAMGLKPEQCIHVGDRIDTDVMGAKNAGFEAFYLDVNHSGVARKKALAELGAEQENVFCASTPFDAATCIATEFASGSRSAC
ncbi:MAG: HAD family hydrolase [Deltaproteobacteria bacterium]|nr:HAD family hydrolase [Deltaproteobacteria bacterium]